MSESDLDRARRAAERATTGRSTSPRSTPSRADVRRRAASLPAVFGAEEAQSSGGSGGSLLGNITEGIPSIVARAPTGLAGLGADVWDNTVGNVGAMVARRVPGVDVDRVRDDFSWMGRAFINEDTMEALDEGKSTGDTLFAANPFTVELGKSMLDTGRRIDEQRVAILPGGKAAGDTEYVRAYRENQLLPLLVEDVGNAAFATSVAAKPVAAGGRAVARRTGSPRAAKVAAKAGDIADMSRGIDEAIGKAVFAPFGKIPNQVTRPFTGRTVTQNVAEGARKVAGTDRYQSWRNSPVVERVMDRWGFGLRARPIHQQIADIRETEAFKQDAVLRAARDVADIAGETPELGFAGMAVLSQVNRLLPDMTKLDEGSLNTLLAEDGPLGSIFSDLYSVDQARAGFELANRIVHDPESVPLDVRQKVEGIADLWAERVLPIMEDHYLSQVGRWDEIHPETAQMLAGDDLLPYEEMRVLADHMETERRLIDARDRAAENVGRRQKKLGVDEALFGDPIRVMRERAGDIERAIDGLLEARGVTGVIEMLRDTESRIDLDAFAESPRPAQMEMLRAEVRRQIDARAAALSLGRELPVDGITDLVADLGLGQVLRGRARSSRAASRETRAEGVRRQAEADAGRLDARIGRLDVDAADLAEVLHDALSPKVNVGLGKLRASVRREGAASATVKKAAASLTRIKKRMQQDAEGKPGDLAKDVRAFRRDARTVIRDALVESRERAKTARSQRLAELSDEWERLANRDTIGVSGEDGWAAVQGGLRRAGWFGDPRDVKIDGRRVFVDRGRSKQISRPADEVAEGAMRGQNFADGTESGFLAAFAEQIVGPAQALQRNVPTTSKGVRRRIKRGMEAGDSSLYAESPLDEILLSDLKPDEMVAELLDDPALLAEVFDDPEMIAALSGDEAGAVDALRALRAERWEGEDFAEAVETGELLRAIDEEAADLATGDPRPILSSDETPRIGTTGRSAARDAYEGDLGKAAEAGYDVEAGRRDLERRARVRANEEKRAVNAAAEKGARAAAGPARRVGKAEGKSAEAARERRLAENRAGRSTDAEVATAEAIAEAQGVAFERGRIEGARMEALAKARREMDSIEAALKTNSDTLLARLDEARDKIESAPARQRVALQIAARFDEYLTEKLSDEGLDSLTAEQLAAFQADIITGAVRAQDVLDNPGNIKGGKPRGRRSGTGGGAMAPKSTSEFLKEGTSAPLSPQDQAILMVRELERGARTKAAKWVVDEYGTTVADQIPDAHRMDGEDLAFAIDEAGMVAVNPLSMMSPKDGNVPVKQLGIDTILLPRWVMEAWRGSNAPVGPLEKFMQDWVDRPTRVLFKTPVLALSNSWHAGNAVGNVLVAWAGGVPPKQQLRLIRDAVAMVNRARKGEFLPGDAPPRMYGAGQGSEAIQMNRAFSDSDSGMLSRTELAQMGAPSKSRVVNVGRRAQRAIAGSPLTERTTLPARGRGALRRTAAHPIQTSYAFNGFIDDITHSIVYLDRTTKHGLEPEVAMRDALRVAGDFSRLTNVERRFARRVLPFYSWMRHITQLAFRLPVEHPLRTAWTLHLWTMTVPEGQDLYEDVPMVTGSLEIGDNQFARLAPLFPFGAALDVAGGSMTDPLAMIGASANPLPRLLMEGATGLSFGPGGLQPLSRPFGTGSTDAFGGDKFGPIGWGPFAHRVTSVLPQTRGIRELLRDKEDRVARYDTGHAVTKNGQTIPDANRRDAGEIVLRDLLRAPILPPAEFDVDAIRARREEKKRRRSR